jgi:hypothetical protein
MMFEWLLRQLNVTDNQMQRLGETTLHFESPLLFGVGLGLIVPAAIFVYLRQKRNLVSVPSGLRWVLTLTRVLILLLLVIVLGSPYLRLAYEQEKRPIVAVLIDHSQSMQLPAGPFSEAEVQDVAAAAGYHSAGGVLDPRARMSLNSITRAKLAHDVIGTGPARAVFESLAKKFDVQFWSFSRDIQRMGADAANLNLPEPPNPGGTSTWIGSAVAHVLEEAGDRPLAGVLLFSDGQNNGGRDLSEVQQLVASRKAPTRVFTVPVGSREPQVDVAIVDVFASNQVFKGDTARVVATLKSHGLDGKQVKVELKDGNTLLATSAPVMLRGGQRQQVELTFKANDLGPRYLTVSVPPQQGEPEYLHANNIDTTVVQVSDERLKVLYIDGLPRWDFRFLKNSLLRDNGIGGILGNHEEARRGKELDIRLEAEWRRLTPPEQAKSLPRPFKQLSDYDVVILGDVSPQILDGSFVDALVKAVTEKGVGLIVEAGPLAMPHQFPQRFQDLLPVRLRKAGRPRSRNGRLNRFELTPEGAIHEATRFYPDAGQNQTAWAHLAQYFWFADVEAPVPGATVLVVNPIQTEYGKLPLIAHHLKGKGRVLFIGTDETFRWRQNVGDRFFDKFWGQSIRFVSRRDNAGERKTRIEVRPVPPHPGQPAQVELMAFTADGTPRTEPTQTLRVERGSSATDLELTAEPAGSGRYIGQVTPQEVGEYRVSWLGGPSQVEARFRASPDPEELREPNIDRTVLETLAASSGGRMIELHQLAGWYKVTDKSLQALRGSGAPSDVFAKLITLKDKDLDSRAFSKELETGLDRQELERSEGRILDACRVTVGDLLEGESQSIQRPPQDRRLWDNWLTLSVLIFLYCLDVGIRRLVGLS